MKKSIRMSVKPLAMATAFAAGTTVSMIATALPGGDTLGAAGVVNESICQRGVTMTVASGARSITTGTGICQLRTLVTTKGLDKTDSTPAGSTVADSSAMVNAGGELYESFVAGNRDAAVLLTPNRALATSRSVAVTSGNKGALSYDLSAAVQPSTGLQSSWLTGTYTIVNRTHNFGMVASGLENSPYAAPNTALGEINYTDSMNVTFNGNGTCTINNRNNHFSAGLTKDPTMGNGEMDVTCTVGGGMCGQNDGNNYVAMGLLNLGTTAAVLGDEFDWGDANADTTAIRAVSCTYSVAGGQAAVTYTTEFGDITQPVGTLTQNQWTVNYNVSADLRYLVADGASPTDYTQQGHSGAQYGGLSVGVRTSAAPTLAGKTYLFNALENSYAASTPTTASYENPSTPAYQTEECISRGSLALASGGACTISWVSSCTGRNMSGYEEASAGANNGTIVDSLTGMTGAPSYSPTCSWSGAANNLTVSVGIQDQAGSPVTMTYTGSASDNGEALVLQGVYNTLGLTPDVDNAPLLPQQKYNMESYMVAQEYQGSLTADADADGLNNLGEFQWGKETSGGSVRTDMDADGDSDIFLRKSTDGLAQVWVMAAGNRSALNTLGYTSTALTVAGIGDVDGDGDKDVVLRNDATGETKAIIVQNGLQVSVNSLGYNNTAFTYKALADVDADGDKDVILRKDTTGQTIALVVQGGLKVSQSDLGYNSTAFTFAAVADTNADGDQDVVLRNTSTGQTIVLNVQGAAKVSQSDYGYNATALSFKAIVDANGDGDGDILLRNDTTGQMILVVSEAGAKSGQADLGYNSTALAFAATGDTDGNGTDDIILRNATNGQHINVSLAANAKAGQTDLGYAATAWSLVGTGDFDGDGDSDLLFNQTTNGAHMSYVMQGGAKASQNTLPYSTSSHTTYLEK